MKVADYTCYCLYGPTTHQRQQQFIHSTDVGKDLHYEVIENTPGDNRAEKKGRIPRCVTSELKLLTKEGINIPHLPDESARPSFDVRNRQRERA